MKKIEPKFIREFVSCIEAGMEIKYLGEHNVGMNIVLTFVGFDIRLNPTLEHMWVNCFVKGFRKRKVPSGTTAAELARMVKSELMIIRLGVD